MGKHNDVRAERAWEAFAADAAQWVERAGADLAEIAARHGVAVTRHEIESALIDYAGGFEGARDIRLPEAYTLDELARIHAEMARKSWPVRVAGPLPAVVDGCHCDRCSTCSR